MMLCTISLIAGFVGLVALVVPFAWYVYEGWNKKSVSSCLRALSMLLLASAICITFVWPFCKKFLIIVCR